MKGNERIIDELNARLADEITAVNQYFVHAELFENWGYGKLHDMTRQRSITEMKHAEKLIERIIFLDGRPIVSNLNEIRIGNEVPTMHEHDRKAEEVAISRYNDSIRLAMELGDNGTRELLVSILKEEEGHIDELEEQLDQIRQMGVQNYLSGQIG
ncbi:bacterioferritin [Geobacter sp. DSM 9736]|uniref:bacterioferritin n=1 Tax=Geobacter sp. DSM 9736 TaxID=1277350 RepID=UPI000B50B7F3|nr:bacterioferritin [Geobacter sp. DSM 9736]SNB46544.1 bacterioferritin [Geobacter sp. DSM 9736]